MSDSGLYLGSESDTSITLASPTKTAKSHGLEGAKAISRASEKLRLFLSCIYILKSAKEPVTITDLVNEAKKALQTGTTSKLSIPATTQLIRIRGLLNKILKADTANMTRIQIHIMGKRPPNWWNHSYGNVINDLINRVPMAQVAQTAIEAPLETVV